jgi:hypothetical protein
MKPKIQYEIWHDGQINGPHELEHLRELRENGWPSGALWRRCGGSQFSMPDELEAEFPTTPPPAPAPTAPQPLPATPIAEESPQNYLQRVRGNTNYKSLRSLIDIISVIYLILIGIMWLASLAGAYLPPSPVTFLLSTAIAVLAVFILIGFRQSMLLVVDLTDMTAEQGRFKGRQDR